MPETFHNNGSDFDHNESNKNYYKDGNLSRRYDLDCFEIWCAMINKSTTKVLSKLTLDFRCSYIEW